MSPLPPVTVADAAVAAAGFCLAAYEAWVAVRRPTEHVHRWLALVAASSAVYAVLMGAHYLVSDPVRAVALTKLEAAAILAVLFAVPPLCAAVVGRPLPRLLKGSAFAVAGLALVLLPTDRLISRQVEIRHFAWVDRPFVRLVETPLLWLAIAFAVGLVLATLGWIRRSGARPTAARYLVAGALAWLAFLAVEEGLRLAGLPIPLNLFEYGFLAFATALVLHDVRRHLELLDGAESTLARLVGAASDGVLVLDASGRIERHNAVLRELVALRGDETVDGLSVDELFEPADHDALRALLAAPAEGAVILRLARNGRRSSRVECAVIRRTGEGPQPTLLLLRDLGSRRRDTARRVEQGRSAAFATLSVAMNDGVALEVAAADAALKRAGQHLEAGDADAARDEVVTARRSVGAIRGVVGSLDRVTKPTATRAVPVDRLVRSVVAIAGPLVRHHSRLEIEVRPGLQVWASEVRLGQVLVDLLSSVARTTGPGGGPVRLDVTADPDLVTFSILDDSLELDESLHDDVLEPLADPEVGPALGVCREAVREMGGRLTVRAEAGGGTAFRVTLPRALATQQLGGVPLGSESPSGDHA